jgi:integrase
MSTKIDTVAARARLKVRREPHWHLISRGCYVGYRKMTSDMPGSWVARSLDSATNKRAFKPLGTFDELPAHERYDAAVKAAREWFDHVGKGGSTKPATIRTACERYIEHLKAEKRGTERTKTVRGKSGEPDQVVTYIPAAADAEARFARYVLSQAWLADIELPALQPHHIERWRKALATAPTRTSAKAATKGMARPNGTRTKLKLTEPSEQAPKPGSARSNATLNRDMTCFRAALNRAFEDGLVTTDFAWRAKLKPLKNADGRRELYLDRDQRQRLTDTAAPDLALLIRGLRMLPLRPGALAAGKVADFDKRQSVLKIGKDKAGKDRKIKLPEATAALLGECAKDKLPGALLFTRADGTAWSKDSWKWPTKAAVKAAGLPAEATLYSLRHSTITDLVTNGLDLLTVAQISGTSVAMIEKHYGHLLQDHAAEALARLA